MATSNTPGADENEHIQDQYDDKMDPTRHTAASEADSGSEGGGETGDATDGTSGSDIDGMERSAGQGGTADGEASDGSVSSGDEERAADQNATENDLNFNEEKDKKPKTVQQLAKRKRWIIAASSGLGGIILVLILFLLLFSSLKLPNLMENIIQYQFARVSRQFAKSGEKLTSESFAKRQIRLLGDSKLGQKVTDLHGRVTSFKNGTVDQIHGLPGIRNVISLNDKYNYQQFARNLQSNGISFGKDPRGRPTVTISGAAAERAGIGTTTFLTEEPQRGFGRFIPVYSSFLKAEAAKKSISTGQLGSIISDTITQDGRLNETPQTVRGWGMNRLLGTTGIGRLGLRIADFKNARTTAAQDIEIDKQQSQATSPKEGHVASNVKPVDDKSAAAVAAQEQAEKDALADKSGKKDASLRGIDGTGVAPEAASTIRGSVSGTVLTSKSAGLITGGIYQALFLACVLDEGATANNNAQAVDANNTSNQKTFVTYAALSDTQKRGVTKNTDVGAFDNMLAAANNKIGNNTDSSNPIVRSNGGHPDTSSEFAAQSGPFGFQPLKATLGNDFVYDLATSVDGACPTITSAYALVGSALFNVFSSLYSEGLTAGVNESTQVATKSTVKIITEGFARKFSKNFGTIAKTTGGKTLIVKNSLTKPGLLFAGLYANAKVIAGVEMLGAVIGAAHSPGVVHNGFEANNNLVNQIDAGADALSNEQNREMLMGRPLTLEEVCESQADDVAWLKASFQTESAPQRYFATSNSQSLLSRSIITVGSGLNGPAASKPLVSLASVLTKPGNLFGALLAPFNHRVNALDTSVCNSDSAHYGNVQFGFSRSELSLIDSSITYNPDENLAILAASGKAEAIANRYAVCFGLKVGPDDTLVPDPNASIGHLISDTDPPQDGSTDYYLLRDAQGNVVDAKNALCSPQRIGSQTTDNDFRNADTDPDSPLNSDLVFRWRLAVVYQNVQNQLSSISNANSSLSNAKPSSTDPGSGADITGDGPALAQKVLALDGNGITLSPSSKSDLQAAAQGQQITPGPIGNGSSGLPGCSARTPTTLSPELMKVMLRIADKYQYQINDIISGHDCDTGKHPQGKAMDIFQIEGSPLDDNWWSSAANVATINDIGNIVHGTGTYQFGFGVGCSATSKINDPGNLVIFPDSCGPQDEIHIDVRGAP